MSRPRPSSLWREELDIEAAEEAYVSRRQLGKFLVLTSLGMFVGNLWVLLKAGLRKVGAPMARARVAAAGQPPRGHVTLFTYPTADDPCLLVRTTDDVLHAFSQRCTHLSCAVVYSAERDRLECPCHEGVFSVRTGSAEAGPPRRPLSRITLEERPDGVWAVGVDDGGVDG